MKKKQIIALLLAALLASSTLACTGTQGEKATEKVTQSSEQTGELVTQTPEPPVQTEPVRRTIASRLYDVFYDFDPATGTLTQSLYQLSAIGVNVVRVNGEALTETTGDAYLQVSALLGAVKSLQGSRFEVPTVQVTGAADSVAEALRAAYPGLLYQESERKTMTVTEISEETAKAIYAANLWLEESPMEPLVMRTFDNHLFLSWSMTPVEYRISDTENLNASAWQTVDLAVGIDYSAFAQGGTVYLQTRNHFGTSPITKLSVRDTSELIHDGDSGLIYRENFNNITIQELKRYWAFDPDDCIEMTEQGGFSTADGYFCAHWIYGRAIRFQNLIENYSIDFSLQASGNENSSLLAGLAIRQPESNNPVYEESKKDDTYTMGAFGIFVTGFKQTMQVTVHFADSDYNQGAGGASVLLPMPDGINFDSFVPITIRDEGETVSIYANGTLACVIRLSAPAASKNTINVYSGMVYSHAEIFDANNNLLRTVENAEVPVSGYLIFAERGNILRVDDISITLYNQENE